MSVFRYKRLVNYYETDAMGVVHHSNYLRYFEEARGEWFRDKGLDKTTWQKGFGFPLVDATVKYMKPLRFDESFEIRLQIKVDGVRIHFQYAVEKGGELVSTGKTTHVPIDPNFKISRLPTDVQQLIEREPWTETWP